MRAFIICFIVKLFVCFPAFSQQIIPGKLVPVSHLSILPYLHLEDDSTLSTEILFHFTKDFTFANEGKSIISQSHYFENLGFFCQKEWQIQKAVKLPIYFRLGSVEYTDKMEGKKK